MSSGLLRIIAALVILAAAAPVEAAELQVLSAGAVQEAEKALAADFTKETGNQVTFTFGNVGQIQDKLKAGVAADVIVLSAPALEALDKAGGLRAGSRTELGRAGIGVAVHEGAPKPRIATPEDFRKALLDAKSVVYADPAGGASSGIQVARILKELGIADEVNKKAKLVAGGYVVEAVAKGEVELGIHNISEILPVKGVSLVGPLPPQLQSYTLYAAGISAKSAAPEAAAAFIKFLTRADAVKQWKAAGIEPASMHDSFK